MIKNQTDHTGPTATPKKSEVLAQPNAHFDTRLAFYLLRSLGYVDPEATMSLLTGGQNLPAGWTVAQLLETAVPVGRLGDAFDEHRVNGIAKSGECSASLVYNELQRAGYLTTLLPGRIAALDKLVAHAKAIDTQAISRPFYLDHAVKLLQYKVDSNLEVSADLQHLLELFFDGFCYREVQHLNPPDVLRPELRKGDKGWKPTVREFDFIAALWMTKRFNAGSENVFASPEEFALALGRMKEQLPSVTDEGTVALMTAKACQVDTDPYARQIMEYLHSLRNGRRFAFDLASFVDTLGIYPEVQYYAACFVDWILDCYYDDQKDFDTVVRAAYEAGTVSELPMDGNLKCVVRVVHSGHHLLWPFARAQKDKAPDIMIQVKPDGHVVIWTANNRSVRPEVLASIPIYEITGLLRLGEALTTLERTGRSLPMLRWNMLSEGGAHTGDPYWFLHETARNIYNGTRTAYDVPPTQLSVGMILDILRISLRTETRKEFIVRACRLLDDEKRIQDDPARLTMRLMPFLKARYPKMRFVPVSRMFPKFRIRELGSRLII